MTCIVALQAGDGVVYMGGDSGEYCGWARTTLPDGKVFRNGEFLIGAAGDGRMCQLTRYAFSPPALEEGEVMDHFMNTKFVNVLRECLKNGGYAKTESGRESSDGTLIVAVRGQIYVITADYAIMRDVLPYMAIGIGANYAEGALYATEGTGMEPRKRVLLALEAAEYHNAGVHGPFTMEQLEAVYV